MPDHELRTRGIRVSVVEPAYTKTQFDANLLEPDAKLDEYREVRAAPSKRMTELIEEADEPAVVAQTVLTAAMAAHPKLRYAADGRASRLRDGSAGLRPVAWWTPAFERTCSSTRRRLPARAPRF